MPTLKEEVGVKEKKYFVCIFLDDRQCLVEKKECPQDKNEKCIQVEDMLQ